MKFLNIIVEGSTEEAFVNDVLVKHFASLNIFVSVRKITTGWSKHSNKRHKGGLSRYNWLKNDVVRWIQSDRNKPNTWYTTFIDLYAFPKDSQSPYTEDIQNIPDHYAKVKALEEAIGKSINHPNCIPYVQLHEFETFLLVDPDRLFLMYPDSPTGIERLKKDIGKTAPEEINESPQTAPSKRIIKYIPTYKGQKAQVGPMVAEDIGLSLLRTKCPHFNEWITKLENL
ncbi:DUF4276 family protein [Sinomicrobium pectinilyticum]|uniref:DUF4276 family protein n=1 Tax=Sinomicrobium pectinilyticum TaxID=1084421 RepID=A0A3N0E763_SINP1|nr:DUF4276 family protein [Sinomicrobium pectinilyticum]RNL83702.1 DUF4276 family protein [Sinomicrobium pectinilyticum]